MMRRALVIFGWLNAAAVMPDGFVRRPFGLPALVYFPVRVVMGIGIGWRALDVAARMKAAQAA